MEDLRITAADGFSLAATAFEPAGSASTAVVIAPAMGVSRGFYGAFAGFLAEGGLAALTLDYRGMGGSRPPPPGAELHDWGRLDIAAALEAAATRWPGAPLAFVGHSVGGQVFGLAPAQRVRRALFVASQSGYFQHWSGFRKAGLMALWWGMPLLVTTFGRLPMSLVGQGQDVPSGIAREWARWGKQRLYVRSYAETQGETGFDTYAGELLSLAIEGDAFAPLPAVEALAGYYRSARARVRLLPARAGGFHLGHFGWFRPAARPLWDEARAFLGGG